MANAFDKKALPGAESLPVELNLSYLAGMEIAIFSEQTGGQPLKCRVVSVNDRVILIDRTGTAGRIDSLVDNQVVTLRFNYREDPVAVRGTLKKAQGGNCYIILDEKAQPLAFRSFKRFDIIVPVKFAKLNLNTLDKNKYAKLFWLETKTINLSAGGMHVELAGYLEEESYLVLNMGIDKIKFPSLVLGQVSYCLQSGRGRFPTGIEFITKEMSQKRFEPALIARLPHAVLEYDDKSRMEMSNSLQTYNNNNS